MSTLKKLAGQTAIYGLPSILGRLLNYFLVPIHTLFFQPKEYGIISEFYAFVAFFVVLLLFGMETTFFRFVNQAENKEKAFNQAFSLVLIVNLTFLTFVLLFSQSIATWMGYPDYQNYVIWFAFILVLDAFASLFLAKLRLNEQAKQFAKIQFIGIGTNILLNLFFIYALMVPENDPIGIGYIFIANLLSSAVKLGFLYKEVLLFRFIWDKVLAKAMLIYTLPLTLAGFAGIINETFDRIMIKRLLSGQGNDFALTQVGIYSANYKLSILISLFIQAYRYAAEPFFFAQAKNVDAKKMYSKVMTFFVIIVSFIFLIIAINLPIFKWFIPNEAYWEGLTIVPILLLANVFLGIYYNQSIWYKLADKTKYGAYISVGGAMVTILLNLILIPYLGYMGAAITTLFVYFSMMIASFYFGQKIYPIKYNLRKIILYLGAAILLFGINQLLFKNQTDFTGASFFVKVILIGIFIGIVLFMERPFKTLKKR